jgi:hypothetical protein
MATAPPGANHLTAAAARALRERNSSGRNGDRATERSIASQRLSGISRRDVQDDFAADVASLAHPVGLRRLV